MKKVNPSSTITHENSNSTISWPSDQQLPVFEEPEHLDVVDLVKESGDIKLMFATLQGNINRKKPRLYLLENIEEGKYTWLEDLSIPYTIHKDYWEVVMKYKDEIAGMVIYDPEVIDSINAATTIAGIKGAIVGHPTLAGQLRKEPYHLEVIEDLRGKFTDKLNVYEWQLNNLWDQTTNRMIVGLSPGISKMNASELPSFYQVIAEETTRVTDSSNRNIYEFDLSDFLNGGDIYLRFDDAFPEDGFGPAVHQITMKSDEKVIANIEANTSEEDFSLYDGQQSQISTDTDGHRFADRDRFFVYRFTPPEDTEQLSVAIDMWNQYKVSVSNEQPKSSEELEPYGYLRDYVVANQAMVFWLDANSPEEKVILDEILGKLEPGTPYFGWFADDIKGEFGGVEYVSTQGVYVVPADWFNNLTVFSGTRTKPIKMKTKSSPTLENKIYVTLMFGEGDNFQYNQHRMRVMWEDGARGKVPLNWTSSPLLYDGAPAILEYFQKSATENDLLVTGPSGVGYFYADAWPEDHFTKFLQQTYPYMKKTGMTVPYVLNRKQAKNISLSKKKAKAYEKYYHALGLLLSWEENVGVSIYDQTFPISTIRGIGSINEGKRVLEEAKTNWDQASPLFISLGLLAWNLTPSDIVDMTQSLGPEYEIVLADEYLSLIRDAHHLDEDS